MTGPSYTLVLGMEVENLAELENERSKIFSRDDWKKWYRKFVPLADTGSLEIYRAEE